MLHVFNTLSRRKEGLRKSEAALVLSAMHDFDHVFGLGLF